MKSQVTIYCHPFPLPDAMLAKQPIYTPPHLYSTPQVEKHRADNVSCPRTQHNDPAGNCTQTFGSGVHATALGHLASQEQEEKIITPHLFVLWINRKLLVQSRSKRILHHWSILFFYLSSTPLKGNLKKKENKGKKKEKENRR